MEAHQRVIAAKLLDPMRGAYAVLPHIRQHVRGTLINMILSGDWVRAPYAAAHTASKLGLYGFCEALQAEALGSLLDVPVCEIYPTFVDTPGLFDRRQVTGKHMRIQAQSSWS